MKKFGRPIVFFMVYVDDLLMSGNNEDYIASINKYLKKCFELTDLGHLHYYLGIEVTQHPKYIVISQKKVCWGIVEYILHDKMQSSLNSNGTKVENQIK